jgi:enamine deaminase RidA (YjgF/YER057c/UK114 family)
LKAGGADWEHVFKLTIFVTDTAALETIWTVRDEFVSTEQPPTSSLVQVASVVRQNVLLENEAVAAVTENDP